MKRIISESLCRGLLAKSVGAALAISQRVADQKTSTEVEVCGQRIIRINGPIADFDWRSLYMVEYYDGIVTGALA